MADKPVRPPVLGWRAFIRFGVVIFAIVVVAALAVVAVVRDAPVTVALAYLLLIAGLIALARRLFPRKMRIEDL